MSQGSDFLAAALHLADRVGRASSEEERGYLAAIAREHRALAIAEGRGFVRQMPKRPPASSVRRSIKGRGGRNSQAARKATT